MGFLQIGAWVAPLGSEHTWVNRLAGYTDDVTGLLQAVPTGNKACAPSSSFSSELLGVQDSGDMRIQIVDAKNGIHIPLAGIAIGNGLTDPMEQYKWYPEMGHTGGQKEG
eukprot:4498485-Amphidinium_carterae.1